MTMRKQKGRTNLFLNKESVNKAKIKAILDNTTLTEIINRSLEEYCKEVKND